MKNTITDVVHNMLVELVQFETSVMLVEQNIFQYTSSAPEITNRLNFLFIL